MPPPSKKSMKKIEAHIGRVTTSKGMWDSQRLEWRRERRCGVCKGKPRGLEGINIHRGGV